MVEEPKLCITLRGTISVDQSARPGPEYIGLDQYGNIYVEVITNRRYSLIKKYTAEGVFVKDVVGCPNLLERVRGFAILDDHITVLLWKLDGYWVYKYSLEGVLIDSFVVEGEYPQKPTTHCHTFAARKIEDEEEIAFGDWDESMICLIKGRKIVRKIPMGNDKFFRITFGFDNQLLATTCNGSLYRIDMKSLQVAFISIGQKGIDYQSAKGVAMDRYGFIMVSDSGKIVIFKNGRLVCSFGEDRLKNPINVTLSQDGYLLTSDKGQNAVMIYQYLSPEPMSC